LFLDQQKVRAGSRTFQATTGMSVQELADGLGQNRDEDARFHVFLFFFERRRLAAFRTVSRFDITKNNLVPAPA
jgi:hypothetical protein